MVTGYGVQIFLDCSNLVKNTVIGSNIMGLFTLYDKYGNWLRCWNISGVFNYMISTVIGYGVQIFREITACFIWIASASLKQFVPARNSRTYSVYEALLGLFVKWMCYCVNVQYNFNDSFTMADSNWFLST